MFIAMSGLLPLPVHSAVGALISLMEALIKKYKQKRLKVANNSENLRELILNLRTLNS